ncbi:hypothetical protein ACE1TH_16225 [Shouchella sp. JSM 1781072]|uniref:hypothetical protein n=1 Tax=Bacillaceae TaxID=186817 RepID=UPI00159BC9C7|nr:MULTISPECIES: hypothetical protein [Bacillaceae]UTR06149.1 hypothetical protein MM326_19060 [Alkalihalobacillus sp. LMS6]
MFVLSRNVNGHSLLLTSGKQPKYFDTYDEAEAFATKLNGMLLREVDASDYWTVRENKA